MDKYEAMAVEILEKVTEVEDLAEDKDLDLFEAELLDSMSVIAIIISIEEKLGIRLQPTDFVKENIATVTNFARFLQEKAEA